MKPICRVALSFASLFILTVGSYVPTAVAEDGDAVSVVNHFPDEWFWGEPEQQAVHKAMVGKPMPAKLKLADFHVQEVDADSSLFKNKIVLIDFWATWCGPCLSAIPKVNGIAEKYADRGVYVLGICCTRGAETMRNSAKEHGMKYDTGADVDGFNAKAWNVMWWPTYALIDRNGIVRGVGLSTTHVEDAVKALLEEQPFEEEVAQNGEPGSDLRVAISGFGECSVSGKTVTTAALSDHIAAHLQDDPSAAVVIEANASAPVKDVIRVMETLQQAGIKNVSIAAAPAG